MATATVIDPAWGIKTHSRKNFLMDLGLFHQLHFAMFIGDLSWLELPMLAEKKWGGKHLTLSTSGVKNSFFCFTSSS